MPSWATEKTKGKLKKGDKNEKNENNDEGNNVMHFVALELNAFILFSANAHKLDINEKLLKTKTTYSFLLFFFFFLNHN